MFRPTNAVIFSLMLIPLSSFANTVTLSQAFQASIDKNPRIKISRLKINQSEESLKQARGGVLPQIAIGGKYTQQAEDKSRNSATSFSTADISVTQPLFKGFSAWNIMKLKRSEILNTQYGLKFQKLNLFNEVSLSFFTILALENEFKNIEKLKNLVKKRTREIATRTKIGRSRKSELILSRSNLLNVQLRLNSTDKNIKEERYRFSNLTLLSKDTSLINSQIKNVELRGLDFYTTKVNDQPQIQIAQNELNQAMLNIAIAKGGHYPSLDLKGDYFLKKNKNSFRQLDWEVSLNLSMPIFNGGITQSRVREASLNRIEKEKFVYKKRHDLITEITIFHSRIQHDIRNLKTLEKSLLLSEQNYKEQQKDYIKGLVTNLDVFQSLNQYIESKILLEKQQIENTLNIKLLNASIGVFL